MAEEYSTVSARLDASTKAKAGEILSKLGMSHSTAISSLYAQIVLQEGLPFAVEIPRHRDAAIPLGSIVQAVRTLCEQYGVAKAWLFGSYARGEATEKSDVDILIDKGDIRGLQLGGFLSDLEDALGAPVDVLTLSSAIDDETKASIEKDKVLLYAA